MRAAQAAMRPDLNLTARLGASDQLSDNNDTSSARLGIELGGPIYQGGRLSSQVRQAMAQRDAQRAQLHLATLQVKQDVGNGFANLRAARASRVANREAVNAAQVAFEGTREEAQLGARTTLDVLDAEQELLDARTNLISASVDVVIAAYSVLSAVGELTARDLNLGVQTYDPSAYYDLERQPPCRSARRAASSTRCCALWARIERRRPGCADRKRRIGSRHNLMVARQCQIAHPNRTATRCSRRSGVYW